MTFEISVSAEWAGQHRLSQCEAMGEYCVPSRSIPDFPYDTPPTIVAVGGQSPIQPSRSFLYSPVPAHRKLAKTILWPRRRRPMPPCRRPTPRCSRPG